MRSRLGTGSRCGPLGVDWRVSRLAALTVLTLWSMPAFAQDAEPALAPIGTYEVAERDFVWARVGELELRAHEYRPKRTGRLPAAVDVHPGAWNHFDRNAGALYDRALASAGLYVLAVDFRQGPDFQHPLASRDVTAAVRWLRGQARALDVDPERIGLIGSSSGGHLALLAGVRPDAPEHQGTPVALAPPPERADGSDVDVAAAPSGFAPADATPAGVAFVIALWPVTDPAYRYAYAQQVGRDELIAAHDAFFGSLEAMQAASLPRLVRAKEAQALPPVLVVQPGADINVPQAMTLDFIDAYQGAGGELDYAFFPGLPHGFAHRPGPGTDDCIRRMRDFIARRVDAAAAQE